MKAESAILTTWLDDLERRMDPATETSLYDEWRSFALGNPDHTEPFSPRRCSRRATGTPWPTVTINQAQREPEAMLLQQFGECARSIDAANGNLPCVRANYGTGILPSLFGAELFVMDEALNTLQTTRPLGRDALIAWLDRGEPDLRDGLGGAVFDMGERFMAILAGRPTLRQYTHVYHPDLQGPMDVCEMLWGADLFLALVDEPALVHAVLDLITRTYERFMRDWLNLVPPSVDGLAVHWGMLHRGTLMLRDDSAMNLSPDMYTEFVKPYDQRLLDAFGGGAMHFCGRGDHYITDAATMRGLYAVNMTQPQYNRLEVIFDETIGKGVSLLQLSRSVSDTLSGHPGRRLAHLC